MSRIHVYEIPDDCDMTLRDGAKALTEEAGCEIQPRMSTSLCRWKEMNKESDMMTEAIIKACEDIHAKHGKAKPEKDINGTIVCPSCGFNLHYSISSYNGHIHGQCERHGCLCWMQ